jgi:hypothetical protein
MQQVASDIFPGRSIRRAPKKNGLLLGVRLARAFAAELMNARKRGQGEKFKTTPSKVAERARPS